MELRDYLRMLRRGWPAVVLVTMLFVGLSALYVTVAPKKYESGAVLFVTSSDPRSTDDLQQGASFASNAVITYAKIIDSDAVLAPVAADLRPQRNVQDLIGAVNVVVPEETTLITITAAADDPEQAAALANAAAASAIRIVPALESNDVGRALVRLQQLRPAVEPVEPVSPNAKRILGLGLIVGLCLGLGTTLAAQTLDTRIRRADDLGELTDVPLLAVIPHRKRAQRQGAVRDVPTGTTGEAFRALRTNLGFMEPKDRRSLLFAAVSDDRDGAQVPANLAWSLARVGRRVLLVDLDLRRWTVAEAMGIRTGPGLADVLTAALDLAEVIHETKDPRLHVVLSGTTQASPSDLLSAPAMAGVLRRMEQEYDYVILHAPAVLSYTDAAVVSRSAGATFLTFGAGRTRSQELTTALGTLANVRVKPLGLVMTGTRRVDGLASLVGGGVRQHEHSTANPTLRHHSVSSAAQPSEPQTTRPPASQPQESGSVVPSLSGRPTPPPQGPSGPRRPMPAARPRARG